MKDILCPTDFTPAGQTAHHYGTLIAARADGSLTLLHVLDKHHAKSDALGAASTLMGHAADDALKTVQVNEIFREGDPIKQIIAESEKNHLLMVVGAHGAKGLRQNLLGADILKLVRHVRIPSLVVQEQSPLNNAFKRIVLPVAGHPDIHVLLDGVTLLAALFDSEVHVYQIMRPGEQPSDHLLENKRKMLYHLQDKGIPYQEVNEPPTVFSLGFAEQTIGYAQRIDAGCIAIMAKASDDYRFIADAEKERMLSNAPGIPVLCAV